MTSSRLLLSMLILVSILAIIAAEVRRWILTERKLRELLPNEKGIKRYPPFFDIFPQSVPDTENGRMFDAYRRKWMRQTLVVMAAAVATIVVSSLVIGLM